MQAAAALFQAALGAVFAAVCWRGSVGIGLGERLAAEGRQLRAAPQVEYFQLFGESEGEEESVHGTDTTESEDEKEQKLSTVTLASEDGKELKLSTATFEHQEESEPVQSATTFEDEQFEPAYEEKWAAVQQYWAEKPFTDKRAKAVAQSRNTTPWWSPSWDDPRLELPYNDGDAAAGLIAPVRHSTLVVVPEQSRSQVSQLANKSAEFAAWLLAVDADPLGEDVLKEVQQVLEENGVKGALSLVGADEDDIAQLWRGQAGHRAFLRRAVRAANRQSSNAQAAAMAAVGANLVTPTSVMRQEDLIEAFGSAGSAEAVAAALAQPELQAAEPTVTSMLGGVKAELSELPIFSRAERSIWTALWADTQVARKQGRVPFTYVEFVSVKMLPPWLTVAAVGGRLAEASDPAAGTATMVALASSMTEVKAGQKFFRSLQQWSVVFWRWAPIAVATEQMTLVQVMLYHSVVMQLAERLRVSTEADTSPMLAIAYDMVARESWAARCAAADPLFDMNEAVSKVDERVLWTARTRFALLRRQQQHRHLPRSCMLLPRQSALWPAPQVR